MKRFYLRGFEDKRAEYLPKLEKYVQEVGIFNLLLVLDQKYMSLYDQNLIPELILQPEVTIASTFEEFEVLLYSIGFAGMLEWLADIVASVDAKDLTRDRAALSLLEMQLRAKYSSLLLQGLKHC